MTIVKSIFASKIKDDLQEIHTSRVISHAKTVNPDGTVTIIAVFDRSTYHKFFHVFTARNKYAPRKSWKWTGQYHSIYHGQQPQLYYTLSSILSDRYPYFGRKWTIRNLHGTRTLADLTKRISQYIPSHAIHYPQAVTVPVRSIILGVKTS